MSQHSTFKDQLSIKASVIALSGLMLAPTQVSAQQVALEEIVVTARKRQESLQDIPLSITAFTAAQIERAGIRNLDDVAKFTPGLVFETPFTPQDTRPSIRGLPATRGRPPIGVLLDGIDTSSESLLTAGGSVGVNLRLLDVERIEVVKGPQSAIYGRVAFGGAINYVTKKPTDDFEGRIFVDAGGNGQFEATGSVSGPVVEDKLSLRLNASYAQHDGFYDNAVSGEGIGGFDSAGAALAARFTPNEDFTIDARISYSEDDYEIPAQYVNNAANGSTVATTLPASAVAAGFAPTVRLPPAGELRLPDNIFLSLNPLTGEDYPGSTVDSLFASVITEYDFGGITLNTWTGYSEVDGTQYLDVDFWGQPLVPVVFPAVGLGEPEFIPGLPTAFEFNLTTKAKQFNQEVRIGDLTSEGFRWAIGGLYWDENYDQIDQNLVTVLFGPGPASAGLNRSLITVPERPGGRDTEHWSVYGVLEYDVSEALSLSLEARYSDESFDYAYTVGGNAVGLSVAPVSPAPFTPVTASASDDFFAPKFTVEYQADDDLLLYGTVAKGVKPGGFSSVAAQVPANGRFGPETLWNYEVGAKSTLADGRVTLNGALFYMDYTDKQVTSLFADPTAPNGTGSRTTNAGAAEVKGLELDLNASPVENLSFRAAYTYLDTEYTDFIENSDFGITIGQAGTCDIVNVGGRDLCQISYNGKDLEAAPKHSLTLGGGYRIPITSEIDVFGDVDVQVQSKRFLSQANRLYWGSFWNVDARVGFETDDWSVYGYGQNIFNEDTPRGGTGTGDFTAFGNLAVAIAAPPKSQFGVRASYAW